MNQGVMNTVVSAIVGGVVGAAVVFFAGGKGDVKDFSVENLKVAKLTITDHAFLLNKEGKEAVALKDGSVVAESLVVGHKFVGTQFQGKVMVANRMLTTPDDVLFAPIDKWRFYTELGSSIQAGGELVVRSAAGPLLANQKVTNGALFRMGFDTESRPQMLGLYNPVGSPMEINFTLSERQKQEISNVTAGSGTQPGGRFDTSTTKPIHYQGGNDVVPQSIATQPDINNQRQ